MQLRSHPGDLYPGGILYTANLRLSHGLYGSLVMDKLPQSLNQSMSIKKMAIYVTLAARMNSEAPIHSSWRCGDRKKRNEFWCQCIFTWTNGPVMAMGHKTYSSYHALVWPSLNCSSSTDGEYYLKAWATNGWDGYYQGKCWWKQDVYMYNWRVKLEKGGCSTNRWR